MRHLGKMHRGMHGGKGTHSGGCGGELLQPSYCCVEGVEPRAAAQGTRKIGFHAFFGCSCHVLMMPDVVRMVTRVKVLNSLNASRKEASAEAKR